MALVRSCLAAWVAIPVALAQTTTVTLNPDKDNTLYESATGSLSNGAGAYLFSGVTGQPGIRRTLVHFNVAGSVPAGARIVSATPNM